MPKLYLFGWIVLFSMLIAPAAHSQESAADRLPARAFAAALDLHENEQYAQSLLLFDQFAGQYPDHPKREQALAYAAIAALQLQQPDGQERAKLFLEQHSASPYSQEAEKALGRYYFQQKKYKKSIEYLEDNISLAFSSVEQIADIYRLAYAYYETKQYKMARRLFAGINRGLHQYAAPASYYSGLLAYEAGDYNTALEDFERASRSSKFKKETDVLIPNVYYKQGKYAQVAGFVKQYEESGKTLPLGLRLLAGEVYFMAKDYQKAYTYLDSYVKDQKEVEDRKMLYRLGFSALKIDNKDMAVRYLGKAADGEDPLAQVAAYHLGLTYISANKKDFADIAFDKARKLSHDVALQEKSAYYYVKVNFDNKNYGNVVSGSQFYQEKFPEGEYLEPIYEFQSDALLNTGNYQKALGVLEAVKNKSMKVRGNIQLIAYNKGAKEYNDEQYKSAVSSLKLSTRYPVDEELLSMANLWLGETYSLGNKFSMAQVFYKKVAPQYSAYNDALYGLGYSHYNLKEYSKAQSYFQEYLRRPSNSNARQRVDALIRLGDCYYVSKQYDSAIEVYNSAERTGEAPMDYLLYQRAKASMEIGAFNAAMRDLKRVADEFPDSNELDRVFFTMGDLLFENGRLEEAVGWFTRFIDKFDRHPQLAEVYVKRAQTYQLMNQPANAVADCKMVVDNQPASSAAETAVRIMISIQKAGYAISDLNRYQTKFMRANPESSVAVEAAFGKAVKPFNDEQFELAAQTLKSFTQQYPQSEFAGEAFYKLGLSHEYIGQTASAVESYKQVEGVYQAKALKNAGDLELESGEYADAVTTFLELKRVANSDRYEEFSIVGLMKAYLGIDDFEATVFYANQIIEEERSRYVNLAYLYKGRASEMQENYANALQYYRTATQLSSGREGAEAQYRIGGLRRKQGKYEESTRELIQVRTDYEGYTEWVYKAFLLIAENYLDIDNTFQAKATLKSIIENSDDPEVVRKAEEMLAGIE